MPTPGNSSGTTNFQLSNAEIGAEAFDRIGLRLAQIQRHHWISLRRSLNLELQTWSNKGVNLWKVSGPNTINLVAGVPTYTIDPSIQMMLDVWFSIPNGNGAGVNLDRICTPMSRTDYAMLPNKNQQGIITQYWFQKTEAPQITFWQNPQTGAPTNVIQWYGLQRIQDANAQSGETPDIVYRFIEALCARLAVRLAVKFLKEPDRSATLKILVPLAKEAWDDAVGTDIEDVPFSIIPQLDGYWT